MNMALNRRAQSPLAQTFLVLAVATTFLFMLPLHLTIADFRTSGKKRSLAKIKSSQIPLQ